MAKYILKRLLALIPMLLGITLVSFMLMQVAPGDPAEMFHNPEKGELTMEEKQMIYKKLGLDQPLYVQYFKWLGQLCQGNFGYSYANHKEIFPEMMSRTKVTLQLSVWSLLISLVGGVLIGMYSALHQYKLADNVISVLTFIGAAIPSFWLALMLILLFSLQLNWLPFIGLHSADAMNMSGWAYAWDYIKHLIMPVFVLAFGNMTAWARYQRSAFLEVIQQDYIRTARSKGLTEHEINWKHAFRNSALPIITLMGGSLAGLVGGAFLTESVFSINGMGRYGMEAIGKRDYPVVMATIVFSSVLVMLGNLLSDILYVIVDPRIKYTAKS